MDSQDSIEKVVADIRGVVAYFDRNGKVPLTVHDLSQWANRLDALRAQEWLPIESAPIDTDIILYGANWLSPGVGCIGTDGIAYDPSGECVLCPSPTHWQPLPPPPAGEKE